MALLFTAPTVQALNASGVPYSGAKLYFYTTGTTTPITIYQDSGALTPHANPVVADSAGRFAPIYTSANGFKVVLKDANDVTIQTIDPVNLNADTLLAGLTSALTLTGTSPLTLISTDGGAAAGPVFTLYRNSASPAAADILGKILWQGEDTPGNTEDYAEIYPIIVDPSSGSEDSSILFRHKIAGAMTTVMTMQAASILLAKALVLASGATATGSATALSVTPTGTSADFTALPAGIKRLVISFIGLSTNGSVTPQVRIGDSGGLETSNYVGTVTTFTEGPATTTDQLSAGAPLAHSSGWAAGNTMTGQMEFIRLDSAANTWIFRGQMGRTDADLTYSIVGGKALSAELDRISVVFPSGSDVFDNGTVGVYYEY